MYLKHLPATLTACQVQTHIVASVVYRPDERSITYKRMIKMVIKPHTTESDSAIISTTLIGPEGGTSQSVGTATARILAEMNKVYRVPYLSIQFMTLEENQIPLIIGSTKANATAQSGGRAKTNTIEEMTTHRK